MSTSVRATYVLLPAIALAACTTAKSPDDIPGSDAEVQPDRIVVPALDAGEDAVAPTLDAGEDAVAPTLDGGVGLDMALPPMDAGEMDSGFDSGPPDAGSPCRSLYFDGTGQTYVSIPDSDALDLLVSAYTVEAWVHAERLGFLACPFAGAVHAIAFKRSSGGGYYFDVQNCRTSESNIEFNADNGLAFVEATSAITTGRWHHVAATVSAGTARLWMDGHLVGSGPVGATVPTSAPLTIGRDPTVEDPGYPWQGYIRELRISRVARYASEFVPSTALGSDADTLGYWPLDEGAGTAVADRSSARNDGAVVGPASWATECPAGPPSYRDVVLSSAPIAYWPFDETTGTTSTDIVGGRVLESNGTVAMSEPSLIAGAGDAVRFSGAGWAAMDAYDPTLQHNPYSVEVWLRHDAVSADNLIATMQGPNARGWQLGSQLFGLVCDQGNTTGEWLALPRIAYAAATTYHVVFTYDGATKRLYLDGSLAGMVTGGFAPSDNPLVVGAGLCARCATGGFCSGCETGTVARAFWEGAMDELAYYDRALTPEEIAAHHDRGRMP